MGLLGVIDIGNSALKMGVFRGHRLFKFHRTSLTKPVDSFQIVVREAMAGLEAVIYSSTNPPVERDLLRRWKGKGLPALLRIRTDIPVPMRILCRNPHRVGDDRLVNGFEAFCRWGGPVLVVDCGTVITFDLVSKRGDFLGGAFFPGLELAAKALEEGAALLPGVSLFPLAKRIVGKDTEDAIRAGVYFGLQEGVAGMIARFRKKTNSPLTVVLTGGAASLLKKRDLKKIVRFPHLTLFGLRRIGSEGRSPPGKG